jgi:hypothetical protein
MLEPENDDEYSFTGAPEDYPEEWLDLNRDGSIRLRSDRRRYAAQQLIVDVNGTCLPTGNRWRREVAVRHRPSPRCKLVAISWHRFRRMAHALSVEQYQPVCNLEPAGEDKGERGRFTC